MRSNQAAPSLRSRPDSQRTRNLALKRASTQEKFVHWPGQRQRFELTNGLILYQAKSHNPSDSSRFVVARWRSKKVGFLQRMERSGSQSRRRGLNRFLATSLKADVIRAAPLPPVR